MEIRTDVTIREPHTGDENSSVFLAPSYNFVFDGDSFLIVNLKVPRTINLWKWARGWIRTQSMNWDMLSNAQWGVTVVRVVRTRTERHSLLLVPSSSTMRYVIILPPRVYMSGRMMQVDRMHDSKRILVSEVLLTWYLKLMCINFKYLHEQPI